MKEKKSKGADSRRGSPASHKTQGEREQELQTDAQIDQINRIIGNFTHDFNNVLTAISGFLQLLLIEAEPGSQLHADATRMKGVVAHGADLIKQMRHLSKGTEEGAGGPAPAAGGGAADLPAAEPPAVEPKAARTGGPGGESPAAGSVLVVDDEPAVREVMTRSLAAQGCSVSSAESGTEALALFVHHTFDCVVLDAVMPNLGGMETLKRMKAMRPEVPVLVVTGSTTEGLQAGFISRGADGYMEKPVDFMEFAARVQSLISRRKSR